MGNAGTDLRGWKQRKVHYVSWPLSQQGSSFDFPCHQTFIIMTTMPSLLILFNDCVSRTECKELQLKWNYSSIWKSYINSLIPFTCVSLKLIQKTARRVGVTPPTPTWPVASLSQGPFSQCVHWAPKTPFSILLCCEFPNTAFLPSLRVAVWGSGQWNECHVNRCGAKVKHKAFYNEAAVA